MTKVLNLVTITFILLYFNCLVSLAQKCSTRNDSIRVIWVHEFSLAACQQCDETLSLDFNLRGARYLLSELEECCFTLCQEKGLRILSQEKKVTYSDVDREIFGSKFEYSDKIDHYIETTYDINEGFFILSTWIFSKGRIPEKTYSINIWYKLDSHGNLTFDIPRLKDHAEEIANKLYSLYQLPFIRTLEIYPQKITNYPDNIKVLEFLNPPESVLNKLIRKNSSSPQKKYNMVLSDSTNANAVLDLKLTAYGNEAIMIVNIISKKTNENMGNAEITFKIDDNMLSGYKEASDQIIDMLIKQ